MPGAPPENVSGRHIDSTSILVTWGEVPRDKQHGKILEYAVIYETPEGGAQREKRVGSPTRRIELTELKEYTEYSIQVLAATVKGDGPRSEHISVETDQDGKYKERNITFLVQSWGDAVGFQPMPPTKVKIMKKNWL